MKDTYELGIEETVNVIKTGESEVSKVEFDAEVNRAQTVEQGLETRLQSIEAICQVLPSIEFGYSQESYTVPANSSVKATVNLGETKVEPPSVFVDVQANTESEVSSVVLWVTTTQFQVALHNSSNSEVQNVTFDYLILSGR